MISKSSSFHGLLISHSFYHQSPLLSVKYIIESGTEIGNSLEFDFVVPPPHS
ncbi:hypothetical protein GMC24_03020 [Streptococcus sp. BIOML-A1]|nr:hypothetical protein [Streptococcus sp. BIOML-A1]